MDYQQRPIYDVIAKLRGTSDDEWVVLGNHHDAWVFGAADPGSGTADDARSRARSRRARALRMEAAPHHRHLPLGRRRARPDRLDRMGRSRTPRSCRPKRSPTSTPMSALPAPISARRHALAEGIDSRRDARGRRSAHRPAPSTTPGASRPAPRRPNIPGTARQAAVSGRFRRSPGRGHRLQARIFPHSSTTPEFLRSTWDSAAPTASITRSTTISTG